MELSGAARYDWQSSWGLKVSEIDKWFQERMRQIQSQMPRGGVKGKAIADLILERWNRIVDADVDCFLEAYRQFSIRLEQDDIEIFLKRYDSTAGRLSESFRSYAGRSTGSTTIPEGVRSIEARARQKLQRGMNRINLELDQNPRGAQMIQPFNNPEHFHNVLDSEGMRTKVILVPENSTNYYYGHILMIGERLYIFPVANTVYDRTIFQIDGGTDWWEVVEREDEFSRSGDLIGSRVKVKKQGAVEKQESHTVNVQDNRGGIIQVGGQANVAEISVSISQVDQSIKELQEHITKSIELDEFQKRDSIEALTELGRLAKMERTDKVMARIKDKLEIVKSVISIGRDLAIITMPYWDYIYHQMVLLK
jgi:hypothetical protein